jgi:4-methyl-5(b-hydroxyethyl)-thiazole monophosphate biosynthesis
MQDKPDEYTEEDLTYRWTEDEYQEFLEELKEYTGE